MNAFQRAQRYVGVIPEIPGTKDHPLIVWWLSLCGDTSFDVCDEVPWCSAFVNGIAWDLRLPRSKSLRARSWLGIGLPVTLSEAAASYDVVILQRGSGQQPGPDVLKAPGHVGFFAGIDGGRVLVLGGNQSDGVTIAGFPAASILGVRRLMG